MSVEFDPHTLTYRTPGAVTGTLYSVEVYPAEGDPEPVPLLLRAGEDVEITDELALAAGAAHLRALGRYADELDVEYERAELGLTGIWQPHPEPPHAPVAVERLSDVFSVGHPPLGATRGSPGSTEDYRWVYVAAGAGAVPDEPLKRLTSMLRELNRPSEFGHNYGRINFGVRHRPELFLRITPAYPRAAVLTADPTDPMPTRLRIDLNLLVSWLDRRVKERTSIDTLR